MVRLKAAYVPGPYKQAGASATGGSGAGDLRSPAPAVRARSRLRCRVAGRRSLLEVTDLAAELQAMSERHGTLLA